MLRVATVVASLICGLFVSLRLSKCRNDELARQPLAQSVRLRGRFAACP